MGPRYHQDPDNESTILRDLRTWSLAGSRPFQVWLSVMAFSDRVVPEATAKVVTRLISWLLGHRNDLPFHFRQSSVCSRDLFSRSLDSRRSQLSIALRNCTRCRTTSRYVFRSAFPRKYIQTPSPARIAGVYKQAKSCRA